jgi:DNA-binding SARP family transcriptional activator
MKHLRVHLLGQPRFALGDEPFRLNARPKALPLLCYLLLHRDRPMSRDSLAFLLWEDDEEEKARANLRRHLHELTQVLPAGPVPWILADAETIAWNANAALWLDVEEFERKIAGGDKAAAVDLYAGDLLENLYDEWVFAQRDRVRNVYLAALTELTNAARAHRDFETAANYAQRLLLCDPWREDILRQLMSVKYESGDGAGALVVFERFAKQLREEMSVAPMPETVALRDAVVRGSALPTSERQPPAAGENADRSPLLVALTFAGREAELQELQQLWKRAAHARGGSAFVSGEPGIGKTRLVSELVLRCEAEGGRILWGTTSYPESIPYQSFAEALRGALPLVATLDVKPLWLAAVAQLVPELAERRGDLPSLGALDPEREQTRFLEGLMACINGLAKPRPLVLVLEDLHWAASSTIAALEYVCRRAGRHAILIVGVYRDSEMTTPLRAAMRRLRAQNLVHHLALQRLPKSAVAEIVRGSRGIDVSSEATERLYAASEGNPLFLGELIRAGADADAVEVKGTLREVVEQRVARLGDDAQFLAAVASVVGPAFDLDVVRELTGWSEPQLLEAVDELLARQLIREAGRRAAFDYAFTHHLVRAAIYDAVEPNLRAQRHRRTAHVFASLFPDSDELAADVARHLSLGGRGAEALPFELRAARHAAAVHAHDEALVAIERALPQAADPALEMELLLLREQVHQRRGDRQLQALDLARLAVLAASGDAERRAEVLDRKIALAHALDDSAVEEQYVEALESLVAEIGAEPWRARANLRRAQFLAMKDHQAARRFAEVALESHRELGDAAAQVTDLCLLVSMALRHGDAGAAKDYLDRAQRLAEERRNPEQLAETLFAASESAMVTHRLDDCLTFAAAARELFVSVGDREGEATALGRSATALAYLGRDAEAREVNLAAASIFESIGKPQGEAIALVNASLRNARLGLFASAIPAFERALAIFAAIGDVYGQAVCDINLSYSRLQLGDAALAKRLASQALACAEDVKNKVLVAEALANLGAAERDLGEVNEAIAHMEAGIAQQADDQRRGDRLNDRADLALAHLYRGDRSEAARIADDFTAGTPDDDALNMWPHKLSWYAARIYLAAGREDDARRFLERAYAVMRRRSENLSDAGERAELERLPLHRAIAAAYERNEWATP